jgi:hypothetical protein
MTVDLRDHSLWPAPQNWARFCAKSQRLLRGEGVLAPILKSGQKPVTKFPMYSRLVSDWPQSRGAGVGQRSVSVSVQAAASGGENRPTKARACSSVDLEKMGGIPVVSLINWRLASRPLIRRCFRSSVDRFLLKSQIPAQLQGG